MKRFFPLTLDPKSLDEKGEKENKKEVQTIHVSPSFHVGFTIVAWLSYRVNQ